MQQKNIFRVISLIFALILLISFSACSDDDTGGGDTATSSSTSSSDSSTSDSSSSDSSSSSGSDTTAPTFTSDPAVDGSPGETSVDIVLTTDEDATIWYTHQNSGGGTPTSDSVKAVNKSVAATGGSQATISLSSLTAGTEYDIFIVAEDASGNLQDTPVKVTFTTAGGGGGDTTPPSFTSAPAVDGTPGETSADVSLTIDEDGTIHYVIYPSSPADLTVQDITNAETNTPATGGSEVTLSFTGLSADTEYDVWIVAEDTAGNFQSSTTKVDLTTASGGGGTTASDLFFSEYIEGSSNNKYLEIANFTGSSATLDNYKVCKFSNPTGSEDLTDDSAAANTEVLSGSLADGSVYVMAHGSAVLYSGTPDLTSNGVCSFNGNDPVVLFKTSDGGTTWTAIDIIGDNSGTDWGKDLTWTRKTGNGPNTTFSTAEWDEYSQDDEYLGSHTYE